MRLLKCVKLDGRQLRLIGWNRLLICCVATHHRMKQNRTSCPPRSEEDDRISPVAKGITKILFRPRALSAKIKVVASVIKSYTV